ncbi:MAG: DNA (cytosine-5-)-methyltransferase [Thermoplasmata archaeon]|jgi:DNA (cytosine-5)-methyltransferase 1|nr:DNA (cytosine-5-)-methyltransferase [Thermoplasmata archaeon]
MAGEYRVASLFAGIGGICLGFKEAGADISWANEIDKYACQTYRENFNGAPYLDEGDIYLKSVPQDMRIDIVVAGFPCQAFSIAGYRKGFEDERGVLYTQVLRIIQETRPEAVFLENVKNLKSHDNGNTYRVIRESLEAEGYIVDERVFNTKSYGNIPQNRERIYVVAFKQHEDGSSAMDYFEFPEPIPLTTTIHDIVDVDDKKDDRFYYAPDHIYYDRLNEAMTDSDTVYQWRRVYVRENQSNVCPTLTANMGTGGHNVPIIRDNYGIRKLTPEECLRFQGFPEWYHYPEMAPSHKYKQAGNSVSVPVIRRIAEKMIEAMDGYRDAKGIES